jgi:Fur family ferric uptake transcriptional regulator
MIEWEQRLSNAGCRITAPRRAVMQVLLQGGAPLSPREILEQGQAIHRKLGLVTVYRTLSLLAELSLVRRVHLEDGCQGYLLASPGHHHAVICRDCGQASEFPGENDVHTLIERVEARTGYRVEGHLIQLFGSCPDCQRENVLVSLPA